MRIGDLGKRTSSEVIFIYSVDLRFWWTTMVDLILEKCQPLCFGAGEQHPARPERVLVQNRRYGVDLRSANAHYA